MAVSVNLATLLLLCLSVSTSSQEVGEGSCGQGTVVVYLDSEAGNDDSCLSDPLTDTPCSSLEAIESGIASMENLTSLEIVIHSPLVELKEPVKFESLTMVRIVGAPTRPPSITQTQIQCVSSNSTVATKYSSAGVIFIAVENVIIKKLVFEHCGAFYNYTAVWEDDFRMIFRAAVHILNCTSVTVRNVTVSFSNGVGMSISNNNGGTVDISYSLFEHNTIPLTDKQLYAGGGGIFVRIQDYPSSIFYFHSCTFVNNTPVTTGEFVLSNVFGRLLKGRGQGGGLLVRLSNEATNNSLTVSSCNFTRNSAFFGGGLAIEMSGRSRSNLAMVRDSYFEENGCQLGSVSGSAGGAHLGYSYYGDNREHARDNMIVVRDSYFTRNCAELGGGTTFFSSRSEDLNSNNGVKFINCTWTENSGRIGTAVDISPHTNDRFIAGFLPTPEFTNCRFVNNSFSFRGLGHQQQQASGAGTLFSSLFNIKFNSCVHFEHNTDSALIVVNAVADFSSCSATFVNNTGVQGGAISLVGVSSMVVGPGNVYRFLHNKATDRGGAINSYLIDEHDFSASHSCFIQYSENISPLEWNTTLTFTGNSSPVGKSIYTTTITSCQLIGTSFGYDSEADSEQLYKWDFSEVLQWPGVFDYDDPMENQIATDGARFGIYGEVPFQIIAGEEHLLEVNITDDLNQLADTTLKVTIDENKASEIEIDKAFSCVEDQRVQLLGEVNDTGTLLLQLISPRKTSIHIEIVLAPCPVGYSLSKETKECECDVNAFDGLTKCNTSSLTAYIEAGFWVGYVSDGIELVTAVCPLDFCQYNDTDESSDILLPQTSSNAELDAFICGPSRTGILCGDCADNHTAYYHSPYFSCQETKLCTVGWLFYILSELVPATVLFIVVLVFNIKFTSGRLNGFILFSQLIDTLFIDATDVISVPKAVHVLSWGYRIIYGFFSLDFFTIEPLSFCLWEGATVLDVLAFKYATIAYSLILIILVVVFMKYFARRLLGNRIKISAIQTSVIHGLSAFLVVCYMQCIKVSSNILLSTQLQGREGKSLSPARVWLSGEMKVFSPQHLPYAIPALICLLTLGAIPPIVLIVYPLNSKIASFLKLNSTSHPKLMHHSRKLSLSKLKPILDCFQGCFKDNLRFFAGLYFVYRWTGLLAYATSPTLSGIYVILQVLLTLMLLIHAVAQPYENRWHNVVDALLLTDLALINLLTVFNYYYTRVTDQEVRDQKVVDATSSIQLILIYLPIVFMAVFLAIKAYQKYLPKKKRTDRTDDEVELTLRPVERRVTVTEIGPIDEFPARMLTEYHEVESDEETEFVNSGFLPNIPPAYDPQ